MKYRLPHTVVKVEKMTRVLRGWNDENGQKQTEEEDLGWFITLAPGYLCCPVGMEKPDLKVSQRVDVVLEPMDD